MSNIRTISENAIQEVGFSLHLGKVTSMETLNKIRLFESILKNELPRMEELRFVSLEIKPDPGSAAAVTSTQDCLGGVVFSSTQEDGRPAWLIRVDRELISVNCLVYDGWENVWPRARGYLELIASEALNNNFVKFINLQYVNHFITIDETKYSINDVFKKNSKYLTENTQSASGLWHLYQGWLEDDAILNMKCLNNLNMAINKENNEHFTKVSLLRQAQIGNAQETKIMSDLDRLMRQLHTDIKKILVDVIEPKLAYEIKLSEGSV